MDKLCFPNDHIDQYKELDGGRIKRENEDFNKIKEWFKVHNKFVCGEELLSLLLIQVNDLFATIYNLM